LIKEGAKLVTSGQDIVINYNFLNKVNRDQSKEIDILNDDIEEEYKEIYNIICKGEISLNEIAKLSNKPLSEINSELTMLEIEGRIIKKPGNMYVKI
jgi:predicted Rossmann fold nucleotide-binding protein DprA/Smf involved in DNA uptake